MHALILLILITVSYYNANIINNIIKLITVVNINNSKMRVKLACMINF